MAYIELEQQDHAAILTLNRPEALNAIDETLLTELEAALGQASRMSGVRAVILTGSGKAFAAGGDVAAMRAYTSDDARMFASHGHRVCQQIAGLKQPVIAAVNGYALGGGCELALACDIRIASSRAKFGLPETLLGLIPGFGGTQRLPRTVGFSRAMELIATGRTLTAEEALSIGLVDEVAEPEALIAACLGLVERIVRNSASAVALAKRALHDGANRPLEQALQVETALFGQAFDTPDHAEGMDAFLQKRPPRFE